MSSLPMLNTAGPSEATERIPENGVPPEMVKESVVPSSAKPSGRGRASIFASSSVS